MTVSSEQTMMVSQWERNLCSILDVPVPLVDLETLKLDPFGDHHHKECELPTQFDTTPGKKLWITGATLLYAFIADSETGCWKGTERQQNKVDAVIKEWTIYANITFVRIEETELADIRICFHPEKGCSSYVGTGARVIPQQEPTMNLGWVDDTTDDILPEDIGIILHEFGHALGMQHEHPSPIRDSTLMLSKEKIDKAYRRVWDEDIAERNANSVLSLNEVSNFSDLDSTSIMMYKIEASPDGEGIVIRRNYSLDDLDRAFMTINYPRLGPNVTLPEGALSLETALEIAGVTDQALIARILRAKDPLTVRKKFSNYVTEQQAENLMRELV